MLFFKTKNKINRQEEEAQVNKKINLFKSDLADLLDVHNIKHLRTTDKGGIVKTGPRDIAVLFNDYNSKYNFGFIVNLGTIFNAQKLREGIQNETNIQ